MNGTLKMGREMMEKVNWRHISGIFIFTTLLIFAFQACDDAVTRPTTDDPPSNYTPMLIGNYINDKSEFSFEVTSIDPEGSVEYADAYADSVNGSSNEINIILERIKLRDKTQYCSIGSLKVEERRKNGKWYKDEEFNVSPPQRLTKIAVVLVLDVSESLGNKFGAIKEMAQNFTSEVFKKSAHARIGIVSFATDISVLNCCEDSAIVKSFINNTTQGHYTALYDAMLTGIEMLDTISAKDAEERALVTFTDGRNNYGITDPDSVKKVLEESNFKINSYVLGLEGKGSTNIDENTLNKLAHNGVFRKANTLEDLEKIFNTFSKAITEIYQITYCRNDQEILQDDSLQIRFSFSVKE
jgi:Mg-chelatase subunit ChlD